MPARDVCFKENGVHWPNILLYAGKQRIMKRPVIKNIKRAKAIFGLITAGFSLAIAIQQVIQLQKGKVSEATV
jgi:hypothetical protein